MKPEPSMSAVINRKRYNVATATLLAHNEYWDGSNWERRGTNLFLYRTPNGAFFAVHVTQWQGERDCIKALDRERAMDLWEELPEKVVDFADAFGENPVDA